MSAPILCQVRRAEEPWYIESVNLHIYSIEELCYFMVHNLALLDSAFFSTGLFYWIKDELHLRRLAKRLMAQLEEDGFYSLEAFLMPILDEIHYLHEVSGRTLLREVRSLDELPEPVRQKRRADTYMGHKKYRKAIECYKTALEMPEESGSNLGSQFTGEVCNNIGVAYSRLFQLEEACECMKKAYDFLHTRRTLLNYLYCLNLSAGRDRMEETARELAVDEVTLQEIRAEIGGVEAPAVRPRELSGQVKRWVQDYHRETGL